jgi:site-specific DNA recombinase
MPENNLQIMRFAKGASIQTRKKTNNCVIYTRVSTKEQADNNLSLETQRKGCEAYVTRLKHNLLSYFGGTYESAQTDERKEFKKMIDFCKKQTSKVSYIIVYSLERFSRTGDNAIWLSRQLRELGITIISVTQPIDTSNPAGVLQQNILFLFGQYDNDLRRQKSMAGTREKLLKGVWCTKAPLGYDNVQRNGEKFIEVNDTGRLIRKAFLWKANENLSNTEIVQRLAAHKFKTDLKALQRIFTNPFYCGLLSHSVLGGEMIQGKHEALVSKEIFLKVNDIKYRDYGSKRNPEYEKTPLKKFIKCDTCGEYLRGYLVKKKNLFYYKCENKKQCSCNKSAKELEAGFIETLGELQMNEKYIPLFRQQLNLLYRQINENQDKVNDQFKRQLIEIEKKVERLEERFINEEVKPDLYEKFSAKFGQEKVEVEEQMRGCPVSASNLEYYINRSVEITSDLPSLWASSDFEGKQMLQYLIFPEGIYYNKQKDQTRTTKINSVFLLSGRKIKGSGEKNKGLQSEISLKSLSVVSTGIEPVSKV